MSYLDPPRLTFVGNFFANVPTLNNFPPYFNPDYPFFGQSPNDWNTFGDCEFQYRNCTVRSVTDANGEVVTDPASDSVIGKVMTTNPVGPGTIPGSKGVGKIVDLDVDQRRVTQLWGVEIAVVLASDVWMSGWLKPCDMRDFWPTGGNTGVFQSGRRIGRARRRRRIRGPCSPSRPRASTRTSIVGSFG